MAMKQPAQLVLRDRDLAILKMSFEYRGITAELACKRFFPTPGARSACYTRLARLVEGEYLTSVRLPAFSGVGSGKAFLTPGATARPVLARLLGISRTELGRIRLDSPFIIQHHLALCDIRLALELSAERSSVFTLQDWTGDYELREQTPIRVTDPKTKQLVSFVPDASFTLALSDGSEQTFLLELDRSTLSPKRSREKLRAYLVRASRQPGPILFVTPDTARSDALAKLGKDEAAELSTDPTIFWLTTKGQVTEKSVLDEAIWSVVGGPASIALRTLVGVNPEPASIKAELSVKPETSLAGGMI